MRAHHIVSPLFLVLASAWGSVLIWYLTPDELLLTWQVSRRGELGVVLEIALCATTSFILGYGLSKVMPLPPWPRGMAPARTLTCLKVLNIAASLALLSLILNTARMGGLSVLKGTISGSARMQHVEGITTFSHAATATVVLAVSAWLSRPRDIPFIRLVRRHLLWGVMLCVIRCWLNGERMAILAPALGCAVVYCIHTKFALKPVHIALPILMVGFIFGVFAGSEAMRSFKVRDERGQINQSLISYSYDRIRLYYAVSVNAGAMEYVLRDEGVRSVAPLTTTLGPIAKIFYATPLGRDFARSLDLTLEDYTSADGARAKEFTNRWGVARPFIEGTAIGWAYWGLWGFFSALLFNAAVQSSCYPAAIYGVVGAGFLDASRTLTLGGIHILLPLALLFIAMHFNKRAGGIRAPIQSVIRPSPR